MTSLSAPSLGSPVARLEGLAKVTGAARYTADRDCDAYAWPVPATIAKGRVTGFDAAEALALPGALAVLTHENAARLASEDVPARLWLLQTPRVAHHGQYVALAVATSLEGARAMAAALRVTYEQQPHDVELRADGPTVHAPATAFTGKPTDVLWGDADAAYEEAPVRVDATYRTPAMHQHPLEPHAAVAAWDGNRLTVHDSTQSSNAVATLLARLFGIAAEQVTVVAEHIGGGFGSKLAGVQPVLAALAARHTGRRVKLTLPRRELPAVVGHRSATIQHLRLAADRAGRLLSLSHESVAEESPVGAVLESPGLVSRLMYAHPHSRTTHRAALLDVPAPGMMRGPGETPGMFALESAMDELAQAAGIDPVELRLRNEPETDPETGLPFSSRNLTACLREGARRFGWHARDPRPGVRHESGGLLIGTGVAASTYPAKVLPSTAEAEIDRGRDGDGVGYVVRINATDIGTGARTVLAQAAADELRVPLDRVRIEIGSTALPTAPSAGGSFGTTSWTWAVVRACRDLRESGGSSAWVDTGAEVAAAADRYSRHAFGAQFAEVQVDTVSGEVRVRRLLGVFAAGRILNPRTADAQFTGAMVMGLSMALHEGSHFDPEFGDFTERDLAAYHVASHADIPQLEAHWLDEHDPATGPLGAKGIGEIGTTGTAAAIANAVHHATGVRLRELPLHPDRVLEALAVRG